MNDSTTRVRIAPERSAPSDAGFLVLTRSSSPGSVGRVFRLSGSEAIIGRSTEAQLQIEDDGISRKHARVFTGPDGRYWVEDLQSTNGTYLNGVRTRTAGLEEGDQIQIGSATALRFSFKPSLAEAEEHLQRALAAAQLATFSWDLQTQAISWSDQADKVCKAPVRTQGKTAPEFLALIHPKDHPAIHAALRRATEERMPFDVDYRLAPASAAGVTWLSSRGDVLRDVGDVPLRIVGTVMDVTERKLVEQELRQHALLFESFEDAVVLVSREGTILDWNSAGERMFGYSKAEAVGKPYARLLGLSDEDLVDGTRFATLTERWRGEQKIQRRGGEGEVICETVMAPLRSPEGQYLATVAVHRDVTRQRSLQAQLMVASRLASVGTLAAGVAHEINNPLAFVTANLDYLMGQLEEEAFPLAARRKELGHLLQEMREGTSRIAAIVRDLKTFSKVDAAGELTPVEIQPALEFALQMTHNQLRHRARLVRDFRAVPKVMANASRLGQVFLHLLMNAAQAIPEHESPQQHTVRLACFTAASGEVVVEVADSGVGIAPDLKDRIFDPFFTTRPVGTGSGLGLSVCHTIVKAFGGSIGVESELGKGSRFRVVLPAAPDDRPVAPAQEVVPINLGRRPRVLVVDDEPLVGSAVERLLRAEFDVTVALEVGEALAQMQEGPTFDAVISDLMMPGETGEDLYLKLLKIKPELAQRMVFMTGGAFTDSAQSFLQGVGNPSVAKPLDVLELREALAKVISS